MEVLVLTYLIGEFSAMVGLSEHTLRFYEKEGLIKVDRNEQNVRIYSDENKLWIENLLHMKTTGMSLKDMKQFAMWGHMGDETTEDRLTLLKNHRKKVAKELEEISRSLEHLDKKISIYEKSLGDCF
ncbi:MerR family transcriptional regulator [Planococcus glaciei]|uniref:MerR family transcriptional regulator n=1 Tax=Planococcus glaciei TaxID=459472 RepID=A0A7H8Q9Y4_9BACL|nr:MerR family transcriptional regulator [Planococcus glaciei]